MARPEISIIGGCGHVGFPLGLSFANAGKRVALVDVDACKIQQINSGIPPFREEGAKEILERSVRRDLLVCTSDPGAISEADYVVIVTGTPLDEYLNPKLHAIFNVLDQYFEHFRDGQVLILRSTVYPTTSQRVHDYFVRRNRRVHVTFCPERVTEGYALKEVLSLPQIIAGFSEEGIEKVRDLFSVLAKKVILLPPLEAELSKLFTNAYRYIHFAIANQFYQIAAANRVDFNRVYQAVISDYPRMRHFPKPGFTAGPCLLKDTMQLASFANNSFYLGHAAMLVNENMPRCIIDMIKETTEIGAKSVGILGMAFKAESDDKRDSLSYKLLRLLKMEAKTVYCSDEYIREDGFITAEQLLDRSDLIIIGAPHKRYAELPWGHKQVFDIWGIVTR
ncbi:MAG: nucleotide sugar dehydrogenase [Acidobacteria bacterium]|nr:nucleotide sugar dehydrogenase [Acidobacteriota bacterium]